MTALVLDTNVVSYFMKGHTLASAYWPLVEGHVLAIAFVTVAEMHEGALKDSWGDTRMRSLQVELARYLVLPWTASACIHWAQIRRERLRQPIAANDAWIAACARSRGLGLVTHDARDFDSISHLEVITATA